MYRFFKKVRNVNWKYTASEIALIFIGITLAIWFNNWNQNRVDTLKKYQYLQELENDLRNDLDELNILIAYNEQRMSRINLLKEVLVDPSEKSNCDSIQEHLSSASFINVFTGSSSVFKDLESTGNLLLIDNINLKRAMMEYYAKVNSRKSYEQLNSQFHINTIGPFLKKHWNTGALFSLGQDLNGLNGDSSISDCELTGQNLEEFYSNPQLMKELMNQVNFSYFIINANNQAYESMIDQINNLMALLSAKT